MADLDDLKNSEETLKNMNKEAVEFESTVNAINKQLKNIAKEEKDIADIINVATKNNSALAAAAKKVSELKKQDLTSLKKQREFEKAQAKFTGLQAKSSAIQSVIQDRIANAKGKELENLFDTQELIRDVEQSSEQTANNFEEIQDATLKINKAAKGFENIADTLGSIPAIGPPLSKAFSKAAQAARDAAASGKGFSTSLAAGALELISIKALLALAVTSLFAADKRTTELAKNLQVSKDEAREINADFVEISQNSGKAFLNASNLAEATGQLSSHLGVANRLSNDLVKNQTFLTKQLGLSSDSAGSLAELSVLQGKSADDTNEEIANQVAGLQKETGIALKLNDVFDEVSKANAGLKAAFGFNTKLIAEQVVKVKQLGLNLSQSAKMASQLLDFESSISKELEAELLTGKNLNLEKARLLALQGKNTEAAAELAKQVGGTAELSRMNVLQQEALAEAMGMERNELIESVQKREILAKLGAQSIEQLKEQGRLDELRGSALGEQLLKQYEQESAAAKFESAVIKIQEALGAMMEGPFGKFVDGLASALASGTALKGIMVAMGAISLGRMIGSLASALALNTANASAALTAAGAISFGVGLIAIVASVAAAMAAMESNTQKSVSQMKSIGDGMIGPDGGLIVQGQKGSFQLDGKDSIIAGTNLLGNTGNNNNSQMLAALEKSNQIQEKILAKETAPKINIKAEPGVSYYNNQLQKINQYNTAVAG
jgi:hypothetical protein